ncbi:transcriptional repressor NF-X1 [Elysia marginata]|uniref:Transcriptional repressor NF-X1 n=1 Tax=Elysia marginata TaxID=1093978 RepID=A0AAV4EEZ1_9GAST|nr:transcriptional repressor NF-X1 [Elysia marginata]
MSWQSEGQPYAFQENVVHPGMYASDFEQLAFYEQYSQIGGTDGRSDMAFPNYGYQAFGASNGNSTYNPMYMPAFPPSYQYSQDMTVYPYSEIMTGPEAGATGFNVESGSFNNYSNGQRGNGRQDSRGGNQKHPNGYYNGRGQRHYKPSSFHYQPQHENYTDYGYQYRGGQFSYSDYDRRPQRKGGNRDSNNTQGRGFQARGKNFQNGSRAGESYEAMNSHKKKTNDCLTEIKQEAGANHLTAENNDHATSQEENGITHLKVKGKQGKYENSRVKSNSFYKDSSQTSDNPTDNNNKERAKRVFSSGRQVDRRINRDGRSNAGSWMNSQNSSKTPAFDNLHLHADKDNRTFHSHSKQKRAKENERPSHKENDESQRATLTEQLSANKYECMVCCDNVRVEEPIWSCKNCYHVFHLTCIKKWAQSSISQDSRIWRCPGCQNETTYIPSRYFCFCGRRKDPRYVRGEIPHSCGESCKRKRGGDCKHPCTLLCHPGPCPPCSSMISVTCDCGKIRKNVRCSAKTQFKCDQVCGKKLNCLEHTCESECHRDPCHPCSVSKSQECFCSKTKRTVICGTDEYAMVSFSCEKPCGRTLNCGNHLCEELCHPGECAPCSLSPSNLQFCACGKTEIKLLKSPERQSCLDPIPTCTQICNKPMACGSALQPHLCDRPCHNGECGPCKKETTLRCKCGATEKKMPCEVAVTFNARNPFKCQKRCGKKKTCGRHKCSETCCTMDIHICELVCGKKLSCGIHKCEELCHKGNCKRCLQASFDELTCYCGAAVIEPPVPCGTRRPECHLPCTREHDCDHEVRHQCHAEEKCPPCTELTEKLCMGGHTVRKNVPCYLDCVSCGYPCNKKLPCGQHLCLKKCHRGDCLDDGAICTQPCPQPRVSCSHPCGAPCHTGKCPDTACKTEITISCPCGNRSAKVQCQAGGDLQANIAQFQRLSVQSMMESDGQSIDMSQFTQMKKSKRRLDCDTNCAIIERNKRLALALEIKNPDMSSKLGNPTFSDFLIDFAKKNPKFASGVEKSLCDLVHLLKKGNQSSKTHAFQSMNRDQRHFVHELAEFYGCQTQSYDYEPNKNVVATAVRDKCWLPNISLMDHALKDQVPKRLSSRMGVSLTAMKKEKEEVKEKPSSSRAWETTSWQSSSASAAAAAPVSASGGTASLSSTKPAAPVIDYFDFEG